VKFANLLPIYIRLILYTNNVIFVCNSVLHDDYILEMIEFNPQNTLAAMLKLKINYCKKLSSLRRLFKDDIRYLADLKQQISQKMILLVQHIAKMSLCCEVISSCVHSVSILTDL